MIPPRKSAAFVWRMEAVLDLYEEPYDPKRPVVCFDERPCQLLADLREPTPVGTDRPARRDHEYERRGMAHVFMAFEPLTGCWRATSVRERRRGLEFAEEVRRLVEEVYPNAERLRLVVDNLSTHSPAAFYEAFAPEFARLLSRKVQFVYTPTHGSWLNTVEVELSVLARQCLGKRRIPDAETLEREVRAWAKERNGKGTSVDWRFTTPDARTKLRKLYPSIEH